MWFWFSIFTAITRTGKDILFKDIADSGAVESLLCFYAAILIFLLPFAFCTWLKFFLKDQSLIPKNKGFLVVAVSGVLNIIAYWLFVEALRLGEFSAVSALRNIVPIFAFAFGLIFLKESVSRRIFIDTLFVVAGVLLVHSTGGTDWFSGAVKALLTRASAFATLSSFLFAICATLDRYGTAEKHCDMHPIIYATSLTFFVMIGYYFLVFLKGSFFIVYGIFSTHLMKLFWVGLLGAAGSLGVMYAFWHGEVTKVVPALRSQIFFSVIIGGWYFTEANLWLKTTGAILLLAGIVLIALDGVNQNKKIKN